MPTRLFEKIENWAAGANTARPADALPLGQEGGPSAYPLGKNTTLVQVSKDPAFARVARRKGARPALTSPLTGAPTVNGQAYFRKADGTTKLHLLFGGDGSIWKRNTSDVPTNLFAAGTLTASDTVLPTFAVANDLLFIVSTDLKKFDGTDLSAFGIEEASALPSASAVAGGSMAAGQYDILITYYNENTGHEGPRTFGYTSVTLTAGQKIDASWSDSADPQVTHTFVYIRQLSRGPSFYRVISDTTPTVDADTGGFPTGTTAATLDIPDTTLEALEILAPEINMNVPPPFNASCPVYHKSRMFVHDGESIYWSDFEKPEAFNTTDWKEPINPNDGDRIVALYSDHDKLIIAKKRSVHALVGTDPSSWQVEVVSSPEAGIGASSPQSFISKDGVTYWWSPKVGPVAWAGAGPVVSIATDDIGPTVAAVNEGMNHQLITAGLNPSPEWTQIIWALPTLDPDTTMLPYNTSLRVWEASEWKSVNVRSMVTAEDADGVEWLYFGGLAGKVWEWWSVSNDGLPSGAVSSGNIVSQVGPVVTLEQTDGSSPGWTTDQLKELYFYPTSGGKVMGSGLRARITANDANTITIDPELGGLTSSLGFVIGGIDFQVDTPWMVSSAPFNQKRYEFFLLDAESDDKPIVVDVKLGLDYDLVNLGVRSEQLTIAGVDSVGSGRFRVSRTGESWRARIQNINPDEDVTVKRLAMQSVLLTQKKG